MSRKYWWSLGMLVLVACSGSDEAPADEEAEVASRTTSFRVPLLDANDHLPLSRHNARLRAAGLETFPSHTNFLMVRCPSREHAVRLMAEARQRKYLLKGPWSGVPLENCVRITVGPLDLMQRFWADCKGAFVEHASQRP